MKNDTTIVMYHYVRPIRRSKFPHIKGREYQDFVAQVKYLRHNYNMVTREQILEAMEGSELPTQAALLTFDDGFCDHYEFVFPLLQTENIQGWFFPPAKPVVDHTVLDVHKIHFILAAADIERISCDLMRCIAEFRGEFGIPSESALRATIDCESRFDSREVIFVKRLLQRELPEKLRATLTDQLFRTYVSADEVDFATQLYVSQDQLRIMTQEGMYVGSHGWSHRWLNTLSNSQQEDEVRLSCQFLASIGAPTDKWVMSYPYGAYDEKLIEVLGEYGCSLGVTTEPRIAAVKRENAFVLPRLDTNDLPVTDSSEATTALGEN